MSRERVHTRFLLAALIAVLICIGRGVYGRPWDLSSYKLCKEVGLRGIDDNASGASYNPVTDSLWVITRTPKSLLEYTPRGELKREVSWSGFDDPEGLAWMVGYQIAVVEEPTHGGVTVIDVTPGVDHVEQRRIKVELPVDANRGLEGITYNSKSGLFYVAQELDPKRVLEVRFDGTYKELFNLDHLSGDLSGLHYSVSTNELFALSQEAKRVMKLSLDGTVKQQLDVTGDRPEGIAFTPDGEMMFIVSEPNSMTIYSGKGCENIE